MSALAPWPNLPTGKNNGVGIYDRDYYRRSQPGFSLRMPQSMVITLIIINAALYLIDGLLFQHNHNLTRFLELSSDTLRQPWMWWQFITYGFVHDPYSVMHIFMNMLQLWFLGAAVEQIYGSKEFLRIYLVMLLVGSLAFALGSVVTGAITHQESNFHLLGASGAIEGIVILFVLNYPHATLMLFPIPIPVKAWVIGVLCVAYNLFGAITPQSGNVAYGVHIAGMIFAWLYFQQRWNLGRFFGNILRMPKFFSRPKFRIHKPDEESEKSDLNAEVDRILEKISREGEGSLTRKERRTLETASRQYQNRRR
ncbi:MAG: rhomboid family intramembrane serine protease [Thermoguttaceae bacterium]|jgi:membrane associated rhomboid family serine protease